MNHSLLPESSDTKSLCLRWKGRGQQQSSFPFSVASRFTGFGVTANSKSVNVSAEWMTLQSAFVHRCGSSVLDSDRKIKDIAECTTTAASWISSATAKSTILYCAILMRKLMFPLGRPAGRKNLAGLVSCWSLQSPPLFWQHWAPGCCLHRVIRMSVSLLRESMSIKLSCTWGNNMTKKEEDKTIHKNNKDWKRVGERDKGACHQCRWRQSGLKTQG